MFTEFGLFRKSNFVTKPSSNLPQNLILSPWNADNFVSWQNANEHCVMRWKHKNTSNYYKLSIKTQTLSLQFQETSIFLYSPLERILRHDLFLKKNKDSHSQKQQTVQPRALACTSAYAKLIKNCHWKVFYLKVWKIDSVFLYEV